ncbi:MAG: type II secretion system F family protein [Candidatus Omnitrophica bacterium]|nr:type II secretion system F family protein [Candidatus Omnitrophota bacterium]
MPKFNYKAKKGPTEIVQGEIDAESEDAALGKIAAQGLIPLKLESLSKQAAPAPSAAPRKKEAPTPSSGPVKALDLAEKAKLQIKRRDFEIFTRQFAILLKANVPLLRIFGVLQKQADHPAFKLLLTDIQDQIRAGNSLSDALRNYPRIFNALYVNMIESGEISGTLDVVLRRLSDFSQKEAEIRSKIQSAMIYPIFLFVMGIATVFLLLTFILPRLMKVFEDLGTELPEITKSVITASHFCQDHWMVIVGTVVGLAVLFKTQGISKAQRKIIDPFLLKIPVFGDLIKKTETTKFLRSLELLYENGISLYKAVEVAARTVDNIAIQVQLETLREKLQGGATLTQSMQSVSYISDFVINMISVGEESGKLTEAVQETASFYEQEANQTVKLATALIEPFMILFIGGMIGFIVIAMLLPIFEISANAK